MKRLYLFVSVSILFFSQLFLTNVVFAADSFRYTDGTEKTIKATYSGKSLTFNIIQTDTFYNGATILYENVPLKTTGDVYRIKEMTSLNGTSYFIGYFNKNASGTVTTLNNWKDINVLDAAGNVVNKQPSSSTGSDKLRFSFDTMFGGTCSDYICWITKVWAWATAIMLPLSIIMLIAAGALYATSAGNPDKISLAKKIMLGVISGLVLIVLARVLLINFVGLDSSQWNV